MSVEKRLSLSEWFVWSSHRRTTVRRMKEEESRDSRMGNEEEQTTLVLSLFLGCKLGGKPLPTLTTGVL